MFISRLIYILCCIEIIWINIVYTDYTPILLIPIILGVPVILFFIMFVTRENFYVEFKCNTESIVVGEKAVFGIRAHNGSVFPILNSKYRLTVTNELTGEKEVKYVRIPVGAKKSEVIYFDYTGEHCGNMAVELEWVRIYDYINLFTSKIKINSRLIISIFPVEEQATVKVAANNENVAESNIFSKTKPGDDASEIFDIRDLKPGDKLQRIHWKLSSKYEKMLVKEYSLPIADNYVLLIEIDEEYREKPEKLDTMISAYISLGLSMLECIDRVSYKVGYIDRNTGSIECMRIQNEEELYEAVRTIFSFAKINGQNELLHRYCESIKNVNAENIYYFVNEDNDNVRKIARAYNITNNMRTFEYRTAGSVLPEEIYI